MKLKIYDKVNSSMRSGDPRVTVTTSGLVSINSLAVTKLKIDDHHQIIMAQDEENPKDWYIGHRADHTGGFRFRKYKNGAVAFNSSTLTKKFLESLGKDQTASMLIAKVPVTVDGGEFWPIITSSAK